MKTRASAPQFRMVRMRIDHRKVAVAVAVICLAAALAGCSDGGSNPPPSPPAPPSPPPPPPPASVEREISPALANPALTANLAANFVINPNPAVSAKNRLFVMLPGTGAIPRTYREIVRVGAARGYHALGLTYPNDEAIETLCGGNPIPDCAGLARREVIMGEPVSTLVNVDAPNSITGRLTSLLTYLSATFPAEGWGQYLVNGQVNWSLVTVAGHSQGSGHAGYLAKIRDLNRAVMFSGPGDTGATAGSSADWLSLPNFTGVARQFGFTHTADPLAPLPNVLRNWGVIDLDLFGAPVSVDGAAAPYNNAHQLVTSAPPNPNPAGPSAAPEHGAPVVDSVTPRDAQGNPLYRDVWIYLAFP